jgi:hypothetical protein
MERLTTTQVLEIVMQKNLTHDETELFLDLLEEFEEYLELPIEPQD